MATMSMNRVIHAAFRRDLQRFLDALAGFRDGDTARVTQLGKAWDNLDAQLTDHHEGEHEIAWPSLRKIGVTQETLDQMDAEHEQMATALATTRAAMATFRSTGSGADAGAARSALEHLQTVTVEHLDHEEREIEPTYLEHADSPEMKAMGKQFAKVSPAKGGTFFAWLTDGAGPAERAALDESVPKPVQLIVGWLFGRLLVHPCRQAGVRLARAIADKDSAALTSLLAPEVDFRALTPGRFWEAARPDEVLAILFDHWFEDSDHIDELVDATPGADVEDTHEVGYRLAVTNPDGAHTVEQQAYYRLDGDQITYLRVLCSGFRPVARQ